MKQPRPIIYDPNGSNPYGTELAFLLASAGYYVSLVIPRNVPFEANPALPILGNCRGDWWQPLNLAGRLLGPVATALWSGLAGRPLIVVWTKGPFDRLVFAILGLVRGRIHTLFHNPSAIRRGRVGLSWSERRCFARSTCLVHSEQLRVQAAALGVSSVVVAHPPYGRARIEYNKLVAPKHRSPDRPMRIGFIGAMRADKGERDLATIARVLRDDGTLILCGPNPEAAPAGAPGGKLRHGGRPRRLPAIHQRELLNKLATCDVVVAPYRDVTESGSMILAATLGIPCIAYRSDAAERLLWPDSIVEPDPLLMAARLRAFALVPWICWRLSAQELAAGATTSWSLVLGTP